jgi:hypothetical protein
LPNYEDFKKYGEIEKQKEVGSEPQRSKREEGQSWLAKRLAALKGSKRR